MLTLILDKIDTIEHKINNLAYAVLGKKDDYETE